MGVRTGTLSGFLQLYVIAGLRPFRRRLLRHQREVIHRDVWQATARDIAARDYALAVKVIELRRLVKGYSDTHARGLSKFDKVLAAAPRLQRRQDAADWMRRLISAALAEEGYTTLDGALRTIGTFLPAEMDRQAG